MKKLAVAVNHFGPSQVSFFTINTLNALAQKGVDTLGLYENLFPACKQTQFSLMHVFEGFSFSGTLVCTSLSLVQKAIGFPGPTRKLYYVWDLEWQFMPHKNFYDLYNLYNHKEIEIIVPSKEYKQILESKWNCKVQHVIENFNETEIYQLC